MNSFWPNWNTERPFAWLVGFVLLMGGLLLGARAWNASAEHALIGHAPAPRDTITVEGEGKVTNPPTLAQTDLGLYTEGQEVPKIQEENTRKVNAIIVAVKELGVADADIQTMNYSISPKFDYKDGLQKVMGYAISQTVHVKVRDLSKIGAVVGRAGSLGANQINDVQFTIEDETAIKTAARKKALDDAWAKARELGKELGVNVVRVVNFSESGGGMPVPMYRAEMMGSAPSAPPVPDIQPGSLDTVSHVSVTFEIR